MPNEVEPWLTAFGVGNATGALVTHYLKQFAEKRKRRIEADKATCSRRINVLITTNLSALIRSDRCRDNEREELAELVRNLAAGDHRDDFLDPKVKEAWVRFLSLSVDCGRSRLNGTITGQEVEEYTRAKEAWDRAARKSIGALPQIDDCPPMRSGATRSDVERRAIA